MWPLCWVCVCAPVRRFLGLFWRETQTKGLRSRSPASPEVDVERRSQKRQKSVDNGGQRRAVGLRYLFREDGQQKEAGEDGSKAEK